MHLIKQRLKLKKYYKILREDKNISKEYVVDNDFSDLRLTLDEEDFNLIKIFTIFLSKKYGFFLKYIKI